MNKITNNFSRNINLIANNFIRRNSASYSLFDRVIISIIWPFFGLVVYTKLSTNKIKYFSFVFFSFFCGLVFLPWPGSDAYTYMLRFEEIKSGRSLVFGEPIPSLLLISLSYLDLSYSSYFATVGLLYGIVVTKCLKLLLNTPFQNKLPLASLFFIYIFILNFPIFAALNARYQFGIWVIILSVILYLDSKYAAAAITSFLAFFIHYGFSLFFIGFGLYYSLNVLSKKYSFVIAYFFLLVAFSVPSNFILIFAEYAASIFSDTSLAGAATAHLGYADRLAEFGSLRENVEESSWFLSWSTVGIFWSLMISGHYLGIIKKAFDDPWLKSLWVLIICNWSMQFFASGLAEGFGRLERITLSLLLLWHAKYYVKKLDCSFFAVAINIVPVVFYFVVFYRIWLTQVSISSFMPSPYGIWTDIFPTVTKFLGFD